MLGSTKEEENRPVRRRSGGSSRGSPGFTSKGGADQVRSRRGLQADAWLGYVAGLELLPHGHEAAARGVDRDGTVNGYERELDKLTEALALDP